MVLGVEFRTMELDKYEVSDFEYSGGREDTKSERKRDRFDDCAEPSSSKAALEQAALEAYSRHLAEPGPFISPDDFHLEFEFWGEYRELTVTRALEAAEVTPCRKIWLSNQ